MTEKILGHLRLILKPIRAKINNMVFRAVVELVNDKKKMQELQIKYFVNSASDGVERFEEYGYTSYPKKGSEAIVINLSGDSSKPVVICVADKRYRLKGLKEGEIALYTDEKDKIHFKRGNIIEISGKSQVNVLSESINLGNNPSGVVTNETFPVVAGIGQKVTASTKVKAEK